MGNINDQEKQPSKFKNSTEELFPLNKKTEIITTIKEYKQIDILDFSKRKEEAKKLFKQGKIQEAIEYDNTSSEINSDYSKLIENKEILNLFNENLNKNIIILKLVIFINT